MSEKIVSIVQLQSFIEAVEFAADLEPDKEWVPTARQWKRIRTMIDSLQDVARPEPAPVQQPQIMSYGAPSAPNPPPVQFAGPSAMNIPTHQAPVHIPRGVPIASQEGVHVTTPNIDTTNGQYTSTFV